MNRADGEVRLSNALAALVLGAVISLAGCADSTGDIADREILVSAAASLTDSFVAIESAFESANPSVDVVLNFAGSAALREQILEGAPADVFAPADQPIMDSVIAGRGIEGESSAFATNTLRIAVPAGNPANIADLEDFAKPELLLGLCAEEVPCGALARLVFAAAEITPQIDTAEPNVRALLTKIEAGELDAGVVYNTDVLAHEGRIDGIDIPDRWNVEATYPIAVLTGAPNPDDAEAFVAFVLSGEGQMILTRYGFGSP